MVLIVELAGWTKNDGLQRLQLSSYVVERESGCLMAAGLLQGSTRKPLIPGIMIPACERSSQRNAHSRIAQY